MEIPFKYKDVQNRASEEYHNVWERHAFREGVIWAVEQIFKDKTQEDIFNEMEMSENNSRLRMRRKTK